MVTVDIIFIVIPYEILKHVLVDTIVGILESRFRRT